MAAEFRNGTVFVPRGEEHDFRVGDEVIVADCGGCLPNNGENGFDDACICVLDCHGGSIETIKEIVIVQD